MNLLITALQTAIWVLVALKEDHAITQPPATIAAKYFVVVGVLRYSALQWSRDVAASMFGAVMSSVKSAVEPMTNTYANRRPSQFYSCLWGRSPSMRQNHLKGGSIVAYLLCLGSACRSSLFLSRKEQIDSP